MEEETFDIPIWISYGRTEKSSNNNYGLYRTEDTSNNKESIFDRVKKILQEEKINVKSDQDLTWGDNLNEFEKKFENARLVIVILNDKYLTSEHCMNEWKNIHKSLNCKKIFYIKYNEEKIIGKNKKVICKNGFDLKNNKYRALLYEYWIQFFNAHYSNPKSEIEEIALQNGCYFNEITQIYTIIENNYTLRSGKDNFENIIKGKLRELKKTQNNKFYNSLIKTVLVNNPILIVGDSVLEYNNNNLGNELNKELERWLKENKKKTFKDLREWNRYNYNEDVGIEVYGYEKIQEFTNNDKCSVIFRNFLEKGQFKIIFSFGYSEQIYYAVKEYALSRFGDDGLFYISLQDKDFAEKSKNKKVEPVVFFDLVRDRNSEYKNKIEEEKEEDKEEEKYKRKRIVFSEKDIVDLISKVIVAIANIDIIRNKSVFAIGTNIPGWGLRFLWNALNYGNDKNKVKHPTLSNRKFDDKTYNFINTRFPNQRMIEEGDIFNVMKRFGDYCEINNNDKSYTRIYVFYYEEEWDEEICGIYYDKIIPLTDEFKVTFCLRKTYSKDRVNENIDIINESSLVILYTKNINNYRKAIPKIRAVYKEELNTIQQKDPNTLFLIYCEDAKLTNIKITANHKIRYSENVSGKLRNFLKEHNVEPKEGGLKNEESI